jgi:eukaryotic-like serine/threonine-protein kinase
MVSELRPGDPRAIGPYRLVGRLGEGGMGQVFLGVSPGGRPAAVKAIRAELASDPQFRTRFGQEVAAARQVSGVYTAMVVDADVDGPVAWLATAYVAGPSLAEAVDGHGPLPEASLLALAAGLAESLSAIHAAGVVHRDLKPSNVLLAEDGPRVIDFGISHAAESSALTQTGLVLGSPRFMSPEQAVGAEVGPPSDIFSLGAVLAFAATGHGPFGTGTTATLLYRVVHETPDLDRVPASVRPLVERCLAKDPAQRPTAADVLAAVGDLQPAGNWLPDSIIRAFPQNAPPATAIAPSLPADPAAAAAAGSAAASPPAPTSRDPQFPPAPAPLPPTTLDPQVSPAAAALPPTTLDPHLTPGTGAPAPTTLDPQVNPAAGSPAPTALDPQLSAAASSLPPTTMDPRYPRAADPEATTAMDPEATTAMDPGLAATAAPASGGTQPPPGDGGRPRRRLWRPLVLAWVIGGLVVASAATAFALTATGGHSPAPVKSKPAAHVSTVAHPSTAGHTTAAATHSATTSPTATSTTTTTPTTSTSPTATSSTTTSTSTAPTQPSSAPPSSAPPTSPAASASVQSSATATQAPSASAS